MRQDVVKTFTPRLSFYWHIIRVEFNVFLIPFTSFPLGAVQIANGADNNLMVDYFNLSLAGRNCPNAAC